MGRSNAAPRPIKGSLPLRNTRPAKIAGKPSGGSAFRTQRAPDQPPGASSLCSPQGQGLMREGIKPMTTGDQGARGAPPKPGDEI